MADVFISYHENSAGELAQQIAVALEWRGMSCWLARRDMPFGGDFAGEIPKQINACKLFLLLLNKGACQSPYVPNELALAFKRSKDIHILPLEIGEFQEADWVSFFLVLIQRVPFSAQPDAQELHQLAARIAQLLNREPLQPKVIERGKCGPYVFYRLDEIGQLLIYGSGPMWSWHYLGKSHAPWHPQRDKICDVRIQEGVTSIGNCAFDGCDKLKNVSIPDSVNSIGFFAFNDCALARVIIPAKAEIMGIAFDHDTIVMCRRKKP